MRPYRSAILRDEYGGEGSGEPLANGARAGLQRRLFLPASPGVAH